MKKAENLQKNFTKFKLGLRCQQSWILFVLLQCYRRMLWWCDLSRWVIFPSKYPVASNYFSALTCLTEFVKKNPIKAAPLLPVILTQFSYRALESNIQLSQIARHLLRAIYQQLRPHKVMCTVFSAKLPENVFITLGQVSNRCLSLVWDQWTLID